MQLTESTLAEEGNQFALESTTIAVGGQVLNVRGIAARYEDLFLPMFGDHQAANATLAIAAVESFLGGGDTPLEHDVLAEGLATATSPGRLQILGTEPTVLIDAAHNPHGARALASAVRSYFNFDELVLVVGILVDKDAHGIVDALAPLATRIHVTQSQSDRAIPAEELEGRIAEWTHNAAPCLEFDTLDAALSEAREWASDGAGRGVLVTGSITLIGEAIDLAGRQGWKV